MRYIKIMSIMVALVFWALPAMGDEYNPDSPSEPGVPPVRVSVTASPPEAGNVSGSGKYVPGEQVILSASPKDFYVFVNWTDANNNIISTNPVYTFIKGNDPETYTANFAYSPGSPGEPEPGEQQLHYRLSLVASPNDGGRVSGGGKYQPGKAINLNASPEFGYRFVNWTDEDGVEVSTNDYFSYTTQAFHQTLTANFVYDPTNPTEPDKPILSHTVNTFSVEGGTTSPGSVRALEGSIVHLSVNANTGYVFGGWYMDGTLLSTNALYEYTVGDQDVDIEAKFIYTPDGPEEPTSVPNNLSIYIMSAITYPGTKVVCPIFLNNGMDVTDISFNLAFPEQAMPDWSTLTLGDGAQGYTYSVNKLEGGVYSLKFTGSTLAAANAPLFSVVLDVPEDIDCTGYLVKINQVSITTAEGQTVTATTRNGRVYVYHLGDNNGDGNVDLLDFINMSIYILTDGADNEIFIREVSDVNEDGESDLLDSINILEILLYQ